MPIEYARRYRPLLLLGGLFLLISGLTRLLLWWRFGWAAGVPLAHLPGVLLLGAINDAVESVYLFIPLALYLWLATDHWLSSRAGRGLMGVGGALLIFGMLFLGAMEYFFFEEFNARFNLVAVDYLIYPTEVIGNIRDTYPVGRISLALAVVALMTTGALGSALMPRGASPGFAARSRVLGAYAALLLAIGLLHQSNSLALFENRVANELAANGPASFFTAARTNQLEYPAYYRTGDDAQLRALLSAELARGGGEMQGDGLTRRFLARPDGLGKFNVVIIAEESLGAEFVGSYGDTRGLTPEFDALAKQGLLFTRAYATGTRTVRGLEAISASFPPIPSESIVKRLHNGSVVTWGEVMQGLGYHSSFLYGGYGAFDNMNAYFAANGFATSDRSDIPHPRFANIWGVSDEDLFLHAVDYFDAQAAQGKLFFSVVMSTSNHKPYTFPAGVPGVPESGGGRLAGIKYADYAMGRFFRAARRKSWFERTVFVVVADHGARVYGAAEVPLRSYEIPMLVLAPGRIAPRTVATLTSQIDLAPTVMGLLGLPYEAPFFGQDVLRWNPAEPRSLLFNHNHDVALLQEGRMQILGLNRRSQTESYERLSNASGEDRDRYTPLPEDAALANLATAYYQIGYETYAHPMDTKPH